MHVYAKNGRNHISEYSRGIEDTMQQIDVKVCVFVCAAR